MEDALGRDLLVSPSPLTAGGVPVTALALSSSFMDEIVTVTKHAVERWKVAPAARTAKV